MTPVCKAFIVAVSLLIGMISQGCQSQSQSAPAPTPPACQMTASCVACTIDGRGSYMYSGYTLQRCKDSCLQEPRCTGVEFSTLYSRGRCNHLYEQMEEMLPRWKYHVTVNGDGRTSVWDFWAKTCQANPIPVPFISCEASSVDSSDYACENTYDGKFGNPGDDVGYSWATKHEGQGSWIKLDIDGPRIIDTMLYTNRRSHGDEENKDVLLQFSSSADKQAAIRLKKTALNDHSFYSYCFPEVTTSFVKIIVESCYSTVNNGAEEIAFVYAKGDCPKMSKENAGPGGGYYLKMTMPDGHFAPTTKTTCVAKCAANPACKAWNFRLEDSYCSLTGSSDPGFQPDRTNWISGQKDAPEGEYHETPGACRIDGEFHRGVDETKICGGGHTEDSCRSTCNGQQSCSGFSLAKDGSCCVTFTTVEPVWGTSDRLGWDCFVKQQATTPAPTTVAPTTATTPAPTTVAPTTRGNLQTILLSFIYAVLSSSLITQLWAIFVDHTWCCGGTGRAPSNLLSLADGTQDSSIVWHQTPPASRVRALACPGWAVATYILWFGLPWEYYRGCEVIICRGIAISCIIHQVWWWFSCGWWVHVDITQFLSATLFPEIILGAAAAYVGFLSGPWNHADVLNFFTFFDWVRVVVLLLLTGFATLSGIYASFCPDGLLLLDTPKPPKNYNDAKSVWGSTPPGSRICALRANAWSMSFFWTATCAVFTMEPFLIRSVCSNISVAYVWFQLLYYFGMHGYIDNRRDYWDYLTWKTLKTDAVFFIMFSILGRIE